MELKGRFAPSPTGRMHLGNIFAALVSWLSVKQRGGEWLLRIEDLDTQRSKLDYAKQIEDDLQWLGLVPDEGGLKGQGSAGPYLQSMRNEIYDEHISCLNDSIYPCFCKRADILAANAPHQEDGRVIYSGRCRPEKFPAVFPSAPHAKRLYVPDKIIKFTDKLYGSQKFNLSKECGDFLIQRADGGWTYQYAVVIDDALMGVTEVVRGADLILSAAQQIYIFEKLGFRSPEYGHIPLLCNINDGRRLSKRDHSLSMEILRVQYEPEEIIGYLAYVSGLQNKNTPISAEDMLNIFAWHKLHKNKTLPVSASDIGDRKLCR